jgi:hypothetical protein
MHEDWEHIFTNDYQKISGGIGKPNIPVSIKESGDNIIFCYHNTTAEGARMKTLSICNAWDIGSGEYIVSQIGKTENEIVLVEVPNPFLIEDD